MTRATTGRGAASKDPAPTGVTGVAGSRAGMLAAAGIGVLATMGSAAWVTIKMQSNLATRLIEAAALEMAIAHGQIEPGVTDPTLLKPPNWDGLFLPSGEHLDPAADNDNDTDTDTTGGGTAGLVLVPGDTLHLSFLGDSTSVGYGVATPQELPGVMLARGLAAATGRPVWLRSFGLIGSGASDLPRQIGLAFAPELPRPDVMVICTGANDVRDTIPPQRSATQLGAAVATVQAQGVPVVAGTCPDFGVITPIPQPLRTLVRTWSRRLAAQQAKAVTEAGGRAVEIGKLVSPQFLGRPDLFSPDRFHPSGAGYARAVAVLLPATIDAVLDGPTGATAAVVDRSA